MSSAPHPNSQYDYYYYTIPTATAGYASTSAVAFNATATGSANAAQIHRSGPARKSRSRDARCRSSSLQPRASSKTATGILTSLLEDATCSRCQFQITTPCFAPGLLKTLKHGKAALKGEDLRSKWSTWSHTGEHPHCTMQVYFENPGKKHGMTYFCPGCSAVGEGQEANPQWVTLSDSDQKREGGHVYPCPITLSGFKQYWQACIDRHWTEDPCPKISKGEIEFQEAPGEWDHFLEDKSGAEAKGSVPSSV